MWQGILQFTTSLVYKKFLIIMNYFYYNSSKYDTVKRWMKNMFFLSFFCIANENNLHIVSFKNYLLLLKGVGLSYIHILLRCFLIFLRNHGLNDLCNLDGVRYNDINCTNLLWLKPIVLLTYNLIMSVSFKTPVNVDPYSATIPK